LTKQAGHRQAEYEHDTGETSTGFDHAGQFISVKKYPPLHDEVADLERL